VTAAQFLIDTSALARLLRPGAELSAGTALTR